MPDQDPPLSPKQQADLQLELMHVKIRLYDQLEDPDAWAKTLAEAKRENPKLELQELEKLSQEVSVSSSQEIEGNQTVQNQLVDESPPQTKSEGGPLSKALTDIVVGLVIAIVGGWVGVLVERYYFYQDYDIQLMLEDEQHQAEWDRLAPQSRLWINAKESGIDEQHMAYFNVRGGFKGEVQPVLKGPAHAHFTIAPLTLHTDSSILYLSWVDTPQVDTIDPPCVNCPPPQPEPNTAVYLKDSGGALLKGGHGYRLTVKGAPIAKISADPDGVFRFYLAGDMLKPYGIRLHTPDQELVTLSQSEIYAKSEAEYRNTLTIIP